MSKRAGLVASIGRGSTGIGSRRRLFRLAGALAITVACIAMLLFVPPGSALADADDLTVTDYQYTGRARVGRIYYDYTYTITVSNSAEALQNVVASASSVSPNTTIINGVVSIGDVGAAASVQSTQLFSFRQNRRYRFDPESINWTFSADSTGPVNTPPIANAGPDQSLVHGTTVMLDGSGSTDADSDPISYAWSLVSIPSGSTAMLSEPASPMPEFFADIPGDYVAELVVNDARDDSEADTVLVSTANTAPVADAGLDQTVPVGASTFVFGGGSFDANGDSLGYSWSLLSAPASSVSALTALDGVETGLTIDVAGEYLIELIVNDGYDNSAPDTVTIATENTAPVADAGGAYEDAEAGETIELDGSFSFDVDDDPLTYLWSILTQPQGSSAFLSDALMITARLVTDLDGLYVVQLIVNDGLIDSDPDTVSISVVAANEAPTAVASADASTVAPGATVQLDGSASSDPEDSALEYLWSLTAPGGSSASLSSTSEESPSFTTDVEGTYIVSLIVNDGELDSDPAAVSISATTANNAPQLAAVGNRVMFLGSTLGFRLFGVDADAGDTLIYDLPAAPANMDINGSTGDVSFTPTAAQLGSSGVMARVTDSGGLSDTQGFIVEVRQAPAEPADNNPPLLDPIANVSIVVGNTLSVQTSASDPDAGDVLSYSLPLAPGGMNIDSDGRIAFTPLGDQSGRHDVTVQVSDSFAALALQSFIVTVTPPNRAPIAVDNLYDARIGETTSIAAPGVLGNDRDPDGDGLSASLVSTVANGVLDFRTDGSFDYTPGLPETVGPVELELQCELASAVGEPGFQTNGTVTVGDVDNDGVTELVGAYFITSAGIPELWVMNAEDCTIELPASPAVVAAGGFTSEAQLGLLDIDGDGDLEIIGPRLRLPEAEGGFFDGQHLLAVHHDGTPAWPGNGGSASVGILPAPNISSSPGPYTLSGPTFADIDNDGQTEIVMTYIHQAGFAAAGGIAVYNSIDGSLRWELNNGSTAAGALGKPPVIVDLDRDGTMEILFQNRVVDHLGNVEFNLPTADQGHLTVAVANFDGDVQPEIIARDAANHYLFENDGTLIRQQAAANTSQSQITVADFDGDGEPEFAYNTRFGNATATGPGFMVVYDADGSILWSHENELNLQIGSTVRRRGPNATAFDANEDGAADIVIHYDFGQVPESGIYIFDGRDGSLLEFVAIFAAGNTGDQQRFVTVVDVDDDGEAEIISSFNGGGIGRTRIWQGSAANPLPAAPAMRDQWLFNAAHLDDRRQEIISDPTPHWLQPRLNGHNIISTPDRVYTQLQCEPPRSTRIASNSTIAAGDVDNDGTVELVSIGFISRNLQVEPWIVNGEDCSVQPIADLTEYFDAGSFSSSTHIGLQDIDGDGDLEIIGTRSNSSGTSADSGRLMAVHHDGSLVWPGDGSSEAMSVDIGGRFGEMGPTFADIDGNGTVEIIMPWYIFGVSSSTIRNGMTVFNSADGTILWEFLGELQRGDADAKPPVVADLDLDGTMEIIFHTNVVDHTGNLEFLLPVELTSGLSTYLTSAVANFDDDPYAEIVAIDAANHYLFNHDGSIVFQNPVRNNSQSQISVADFDGDGELEYAWHNGFGSTLVLGYMEVYDTDGSLLWSHNGIRELGEELNRFNGVNPIAFDANNDGAFDLVVNMNVFTGTQDDGVYIFDGRDGSVLEFLPIRYASREQRFVTVADLDSDGEAEIVSSFTSLDFALRVWEGTPSHALPNAPAHRSQWISNEAYTDASGNTLSNPVPHWLQPGLNGYNLIKLPPDPLAGTTDSFTYVANDGQLDSNAATVTFDVQPAGLAPVFLSQPDVLTTVGFPYEYAPRVVDVDPGDTVSFTLAAAPAGMTMTANGRLNWLPDTEGSFQVSVIASDTIGFATPQSFTLLVGQPVVVPELVGQTEAAANTALTGANLLSGTVRNETHPTIAAGSITSQTPIAGAVAEFGAAVDLIVSTGPAPEDIDDDNDGFTENQGDCDDRSDAIAPGLDDGVGDGIDQDCDGIDGNLVLSEILVSPATTTVLAGQPVALMATGIFENGTSQNLTGVVSWTNGPNFSSVTAGSFTAMASRDGIDATAIINVDDRVAGDTLPPVATIAAPVSNAPVTEPVDVTGSAGDANFLKYELAYAPAGETSYTTIVTSTTPVTDGVLGQFDPTLLVNDLYTIRLTVFDAGGNQSRSEVSVQVAGNMKVGNFMLNFIDLQIPMSGIPISVVRSYDSRDKAVGDFGVGWKLGLQSMQIRTNRIPGTGWRVDRSGLAFVLTPTDQQTAIIRLPDGRVEVFDLFVTPDVSPLVPFPPSTLSASYRPRIGTLGQLRSLENNFLSIFSPQPGAVELTSDATSAAYNPDLFLYTHENGTEVVISKRDGVRSIRDRNGNTITISRDGIAHSDGKSVIFDRDDLGRIASITDPAGNIQLYGYDANGDLSRHEDVLGNVTRFEYNRDHGLIQILDPLGRSAVRTEYDEAGRIVAVTDGEGETTRYQHDLAARIETVVYPGGENLVETYDSRGNVLREVDEDGVVTEYEWNDSDRLTAETNGRGSRQQLNYDAFGGLLSIAHSVSGAIYEGVPNDRGLFDQVLGPLGQDTRYTFDSRGNVLTSIDSLGYERRFTYDDRGNRTSITRPDGTVERFEYTPSGELAARIRPTGNRAEFSYDVNGNQLTQTSQVATFEGMTSIRSEQEYDAAGRPIRMIDPNGNQVVIERDYLGRETALIDSLGRRLEQQRNARGEIVAVTFPDGTTQTVGRDPRGFVTGFEARDGRQASIDLAAGGAPLSVVWSDSTPADPTDNPAARYASNDLGLLAGATSMDGRQVIVEHRDDGAVQSIEIDGVTRDFELDARERVTSETDSAGRRTLFEYDALDRHVRTTFADGSVASREYDAIGQVTRIVDEQGRTLDFTYDLLGQVESVTDGLGSVTGYRWDELGRLLSQTDANGNRTVFEYSPRGERTGIIYPDGTRLSLVYNAAGELVRRRNPDGTTVEYEYDPGGRLIRKIVAGVGFNATYDAVGRRLSSEDPRGVSDYRYDEYGRLEERTEPDGSFVRYRYDSNGNVIELETPTGTVSHSYDARGRLEQIIDRDGEATSYEYDNLNRLTRASGSVLTYEREYDLRDRVSRVVYRDALDSVIAQYDYTHDRTGRITSVAQLDGDQVDFEYDIAGRLIRESRLGALADEILYSLDPVGNVRSTSSVAGGLNSYTYDPGDRLLSSNGPLGDVVYDYDASGRLIAESGVRTASYAWSADDRMVQYVADSGAVVDFIYDWDGLLVGRRSAAAEVGYLQDHSGAYPDIVEESPAGEERFPITHGIGPLSQGAGPDKRRFVNDAHSGIRGLVGAGGIEAPTAYSAFGQQLGAGGTARLGYRGEWQESATGNVYLRERHYDPRSMRFLSRDPASGTLTDPGTLHDYLYAKGDPVNFTDPTGRTSLPEIGVSLGLISGLQAGQSKFTPISLGTTQDVSWDVTTIFGGGADIGFFYGLGVALGGSALKATSQCLPGRKHNQWKGSGYVNASLGVAAGLEVFFSFLSTSKFTVFNATSIDPAHFLRFSFFGHMQGGLAAIHGNAYFKLLLGQAEFKEVKKAHHIFESHTLLLGAGGGEEVGFSLWLLDGRRVIGGCTGE